MIIMMQDYDDDDDDRFNFLKPILSNLLTPLSLSGAKRFLQFLFEGKFPLS